MNYKLNISSGGMIFSKFTIAMHNCLKLENIENLYFNITDTRMPGNHYFDYILDQKLDDTYKAIECKYMGIYGQDDLHNQHKITGKPLGPLEDSPDLMKYKEIAKKIKIHSHIRENVADLKKNFNIGDKTLGVHLRATGNNYDHCYLGMHLSSDYMNKIDEILKIHDIDNIFLATDNEESIKILSDRYGDMINYRDITLRAKGERDGDWYGHHVGYRMRISDKVMWDEVIVDVLLLAECPYMLCRVGNPSHGAMMFSPHNQKIYRPFNHYQEGYQPKPIPNKDGRHGI